MFRRYYFYLTYAAVSLIYIIASLLAPLGPTRYNLTPTKTHVLQLTIYLPIVLIWGVAIYGAENFKRYTNSIKRYEDGKALNIMANGLIILVSAIIFNGFFGLLRPWAIKDGWLSPFTISSNLLAVWLPLVAFSFIYVGSLQLRHIIKKGRFQMKSFIPLLVVLALIAVFYITSLFSYKYLTSTPDPTKYSSFYMSDVMVLLLIAIPYLAGWALALKAALNLAEYSRSVKGVIYRDALSRLTLGIAFFVAFYVLVQLLFAFSTYFARAGLASILLIVYLLILLYGLGFLIVASGAKKLNHIEGVGVSK